MWWAESLEKTLMLGKIEGKRRREWDGWMLSSPQWAWVWANSDRDIGGEGSLACCNHGVTKRHDLVTK